MVGGKAPFHLQPKRLSQSFRMFQIYIDTNDMVELELNPQLIRHVSLRNFTEHKRKPLFWRKRFGNET